MAPQVPSGPALAALGAMRTTERQLTQATEYAGPAQFSGVLTPHRYGVSIVSCDVPPNRSL